MSIKRWKIERTASRQQDDSLVEAILRQRGYGDASVTKFLEPSLGDLHDPFLLLGMTETVARIKGALAAEQQITIYGDYDVDGMTATAIMHRLISHLGGRVNYYIPRRLDEGYGLNGAALRQLAEAGSQLIISVDCGISAWREADLAKRLGVDLIITDHHSVPTRLPAAYAIINPKQADCRYPYDGLAGAGVALKIAQAFLAVDSELFQSLLVLAAVGTIADIMPLKDENRIIAHFGLDNFWSSQNLGLQILAEVAGLADKAINAGHIGFMIGPRLNAVGRLDHARRGVQLLLGTAAAEVRSIAEQLDQLNQRRRASEADILEEALHKIAHNPRHSAAGTLVVWGEGWHVGVIGIVASRLVERFYRPCVVLTQVGDELKGSARSIAGYSIYDALKSQSDLLAAFGGHQQAAGLTLTRDALDDFIDGLADYNKSHLTADLLAPTIAVDSAIRAAQISHQLIDQIEKMAPFGVANARPLFVMTGLMVEQTRRIGKDGAHLKMVVNAADKLLDVIQFNVAGNRPLAPYHCRVDSVFNLSLNHFNGVESIQLNQRDMRVYLPGDSAFNKTCYAIYIDALVGHFMAGTTAAAARPATRRTAADLVDWVKGSRPVVLSSYEGLLAYAYACYDAGIDYRAQLQSGKIKLLPTAIEASDIVADVPLFSAGQSALRYYHPLDHGYLLKCVADIFFDRKHFSALYKKIRHDSPLDVIKLLEEASDALLDRLAIAFFEEAGFISRCGSSLTMTENRHQKYNFNGCQTQRTFEDFKRGLYRVVTANQALMP